MLRKYDKAWAKFKEFEQQNLDRHESDFEREENEGKTGFDMLHTKGQKNRRTKFMTPDLWSATLKKGTYLKEVVDDEKELKHKKTLVINQLLDYEQKHQTLNKLDKIKVEDKVVSWPCDTSIITSKTLEVLFQYFDLTPGEDVNQLNKKLHQQWIETQGRKPNKVKKANRRASAEPVEQEESFEES